MEPSFQSVTNLPPPNQRPNSSAIFPMNRLKFRFKEFKDENKSPVVHSHQLDEITFRQAPPAGGIAVPEVLGLLPLGVLAIQAPILYVLFAFIIANLSLIGVGRGELTRNLANAEDVLENINTFTAGGGAARTPLLHINSTASNNKKKKKTSDLEENVLLHKHVLIPGVNSVESVSTPVVIAALLLIVYGILRVGVFPGVLSGILTYFLFSNYFGHVRRDKRRHKRVRGRKSLNRRSFHGSIQHLLPYESESIVNLIESYSPFKSFK